MIMDDKLRTEVLALLEQAEQTSQPVAPANEQPKDNSEVLIHSSTDRMRERPYTETLPNRTIVTHN